MLSDADANVRKPKEKPMRSKRPHGKANATADVASEAAGDNAEPAEPKDEELPDVAPAQEEDTPGLDEPKEESKEVSKDDLAGLSTENPPEGRDLEKDGELPGESDDSGIGAFNIFAAWRRRELSKQDNSDVDTRATLLAEWKEASESAKQTLAEKFKELGSRSKILEQISEHDWQPPSIPTKLVTKEATSPPQPKDEDVEMEDGDAEKSEAPAEKE